MSISQLSSRVAPASVRLDSRSAEKNNLRRILVIGDFLSAFAAWFIASSTPGMFMQHGLAHPEPVRLAIYFGIVIAATFVTLSAIASQQLYLARVASMRTLEIAKLARVSLLVGAVALIGGRILDAGKPVRFPVLVAVLTFFFVNFFRMGFNAWLDHARSQGRYSRGVLLIGANDDAVRINRLMKTYPELGYRICGVVGDRSFFEQHDFGDTPFVGELANLERILQDTEINGAFIAGGAFSQESVNKVVRTLLIYGVHIQLSTGLRGIDHRRMRSQAIAFEPILYVENADLEPWQLIVKRVIDIAIAGFVVLITAPIMAVTALIVKLQDGGPVLFHQKRVGQKGELFTILKFRSMSLDAEERMVDLRDGNVREGPLFKLASDPRVTKFGKIIRATSIDELPQLFNVLKGEMSLIGPRPALPLEVVNFDNDLHARHYVLPGITGLWQVNGRDNPDFSLYQRMDLFYVENWSVALDMWILVATAKVVVKRAVRSFTGRLRRGRTGSQVMD